MLEAAQQYDYVCLLLFIHIHDKDPKTEFQVIHPNHSRSQQMTDQRVLVLTLKIMVMCNLIFKYWTDSNEWMRASGNRSSLKGPRIQTKIRRKDYYLTWDKAVCFSNLSSKFPPIKFKNNKFYFTLYEMDRTCAYL